MIFPRALPRTWSPLTLTRPFHISTRAKQRSDGGSSGSGGNGKKPKEPPREPKEEQPKEEEPIEDVVEEEAPSGEYGRGISRLQKALNAIESSIVSVAPVENVKRVPILSTFHRPLFPGFQKAVTITDKSTIKLIQKRLTQNQPYLGIFLSKLNDYEQNPSGTAAPVKFRPDVHSVGSLCQIFNAFPGPAEALTLLLYPHKRIGIRSFAGPGPKTEIPEVDLDASSTAPEQFLKTAFITIDEMFEIESENDLSELVKQVIEELTEISLLNPLVRDQISEFYRVLGISNKERLVSKKLVTNASKLADFAVSMCDADAETLQDVLATLPVEERLQKSLELLKKELINAELQHEIRGYAEKVVNERDKAVFLQSRLKSIQKELGMETIAREKVMEKFQQRCKDLIIPIAAKKAIDEEMGKLGTLRPSSQEYNLSTQYLDWLTLVPWGKNSSENLDVIHAAKVLDEDHYGLKDVKERILEFIAVGKMRGTVEGKIICLNGPPGVGKTSVGKSIAKALNREFYRFSVGGLYDVAEIKGHRRTYVGAMPGKLVQALKKVQTQNPLILIDEVDKIAKGGHNGDPSSALLEVLDPEQNSTFIDHYMDIPIDLSKVLFVCTANTLDTIPGPLLDRMEVVNLSGYVADEKKAIANGYLIPTVTSTTGLSNKDATITPEALEALINSYCRESGVRNLKKHIEKVFRKAALQHITDATGEPIVVTPSNLKQYVGSPLFSDKRMYTEAPPAGVVMGLAYNSMGGANLYIESVLEAPLKEKQTPSFSQTGNFGSVMKESSQISYFYARSLLSSVDPSNDFFKHAAIHLHVPEGATPKDGPSAGISMTSSLMSLATGKPIDPNLAMTGEITLTGRVLKIGGVKEKVMAARRADITRLILPQDNRNDFEELDENIRSGIHVDFVADYRQVYDLLFGN